MFPALLLMAMAISVGLVADSYFDGRLPRLIRAWRGGGSSRQMESGNG